MPNVRFSYLFSLILYAYTYYAYNTHAHTYLFRLARWQLINFSYFSPPPHFHKPNYVIKSVFNNYAFPGTAQQTVETSALARFMHGLIAEAHTYICTYSITGFINFPAEL